MKKSKKLLAVAMACAMLPAAQSAKAGDEDTLRLEKLQEVVVKGVWAPKHAPFAVANMKKKELEDFSKTGRELPFLFSQTPGVLAWGENGLGTGTVNMRIRGAAGSRINVTIDGVPLNSPEDQTVFWANMNSYGSLLGRAQIQRGVGTSTNGDGAFGGTVALSTKTPSERPSGEVSASYGSYNTLNVGAQFSSGLLKDHFIIDGAWHQTTTDGFIDGTGGRSGCYYGGVTWQNDNLAIRYKNLGNYERTGQAWNGVTAGTNDLSIMDGTYGSKTGIRTYKDMWNAGLGKYNSLYEGLTINDDGTYTTSRYQMYGNDGQPTKLWDKTTDNFWQNHNILSSAWTINDELSVMATAHYTYGHGYYEEFRADNKLSKFGLTATDDDGNNIKRADFVRKKGTTQHTYGIMYTINYKNEHIDLIGGRSVQRFDGSHFGFLNYTSNPFVRKKYLAGGSHRYYDSDATKVDYSNFLKATVHINPQWDVFGDLQFRFVSYKINGYNDKFYDDASRLYNQPLDIDKKYGFFNPKGGVSWHHGGHNAYLSVAHSHREPERNNFTDNGKYPAPKAEQLTDWEMGYELNLDHFNLGLNLYYMDYTNQFVQTGEKSDIGENLTTNIKDSYRTGVELSASWSPLSWLTIGGNAALSENKLKDFEEVVEDWDNYDTGTRTIHYDDAQLAFSPSVIANAFVNLQWKGWQATWHTNHVSRQYLDNTENRDRSLPAFTTSNVSMSYQLPWKWLGIKETIVAFNVNNVFDEHYAQSGWVYSAIYESGGHGNDNRYYQIGFMPSAGRTVMGTITLKF
ncbi:MAG: TonB-dependent receptor [Prevotella sp.]|nr:TonB-dependent receptor [Prevotella sp.]